MRTPSAADYKSNVNRLKNDLPNPGTNIRKLYDILVAHAGKSISATEIADLGFNRYSNNTLPSTIRQLRDFYGMEILQMGRGRQGSSYLLCGEYLESGVYVSYLEEEK